MRSLPTSSIVERRNGVRKFPLVVTYTFSRKYSPRERLHGMPRGAFRKGSQEALDHQMTDERAMPRRLALFPGDPVESVSRTTERTSTLLRSVDRHCLLCSDFTRRLVNYQLSSC